MQTVQTSTGLHYVGLDSSSSKRQIITAPPSSVGMECQGEVGSAEQGANCAGTECSGGKEETGGDAVDDPAPSKGASRQDAPDIAWKAAQYYQKKGLMVFPVRRGEKTPQLSGWQKTLLEKDLHYWLTTRCCNVGIQTGSASGGVLVIDFDIYDHFLVWSKQYPELTHTPCTKTPRGIHLYFRYTGKEKPPLYFSIKKDGEKTGDTRWQGMYVVAPPSIVDGKEYQWINTLETPMIEISSFDQLHLCTWSAKGSRTEKTKKVRNKERYIEKARENIFADLLGAVEGARNNELVRAAYSMARITEDDEAEPCQEAFSNVAQGIGLEQREIEKTIESGWKAGKQNKIEFVEEETPGKGSGYKCTDSGNVERFISLFRDDARYIVEKSKWFTWSGKVWMEDSGKKNIYGMSQEVIRHIYREAAECTDSVIREKIGEWARRSESMEKIKAMIAGAGMVLAESIKTFDSDKMLFNVQNGTVNLVTGQLQPHNKMDMITKISPVNFNQGANCPLWGDTLSQVFKGDSTIIDYFQTLAGYTLSGNTREQCLFFSYGKGANGKSTIIETLFYIMGDYAKRIPSASLMSKAQRSAGGASEDVARLLGARMILSSEIEDGQRINESLIKDMTGGDTLMARHLYSSSFEFKLDGKIFMYGNHKPHIRGTDHGIQRRMRLLPFEHIFTQPDREMPSKLRQEAEGILCWMMTGCLKWQQDGLTTPARVKLSTSEYLAGEDTIGEFIRENIEEAPGEEIKVKDLFNLYREWNEGGYCFSRRKFTNDLMERGLNVVQKRARESYLVGYSLTGKLDFLLSDYQ